jgi:hypothetical protein
MSCWKEGWFQVDSFETSAPSDDPSFIPEKVSLVFYRVSFLTAFLINMKNAAHFLSLQGALFLGDFPVFPWAQTPKAHPDYSHLPHLCTGSHPTKLDVRKEGIVTALRSDKKRLLHGNKEKKKKVKVFVFGFLSNNPLVRSPRECVKKFIIKQQQGNSAIRAQHRVKG